jgi:hypothetical protein
LLAELENVSYGEETRQTIEMLRALDSQQQPFYDSGEEEEVEDHWYVVQSAKSPAVEHNINGEDEGIYIEFVTLDEC